MTQSFIKLPCLLFLICKRKFVKVIVRVLVISINKWIIFLLEKLVVSKGAKIFPHLLEPENSNRVRNSPPIVSVLSHIHPLHILTFKPGYSKWCLSLRLSFQTPVHVPCLTHACHLSIPFLPPYIIIPVVFGED